MDIRGDTGQIRKVYAITFLDSLCMGMMLPVFNQYITVVLEGSHTLVGTLGSLEIVMQLFTAPILRSSRSTIANKHALQATMLCMLLLNIILASTHSWKVIVIVRGISFLINHTTKICTAIIISEHPEYEHEIMFTIMDAMRALGVLIGPILGAYYYDGTSILTVVQFIIAINVTNILICTNLDYYEPEEKTWPTPVAVLHDAIDTVQHFDVSNHLLVLLIRFLTLISYATFSSKFSLLIKRRFHATIMEIGYTIAYQNSCMYVARLLIVYVIIWKKNVKLSLIFSISILLIVMVQICYVEKFEHYLALYVFLSLALAFLEKLWEEVYMNEVTSKVITMILSVLQIAVPVVFNLFFDIYGLNALHFSTIAPLTLALALSLFYKYKDKSN